jgi:adenosylcobinamide-phosphate synthase
LVLATAFGWRAIHDRLTLLVDHNHDMSLYECRKLLAECSPFDTEPLDNHGVFRHGTELLARAFAERVIGMGFWYLLGGLPAACLYLVVHRVDGWLDYDSSYCQPFSLAISPIYWLMHAPVLVLAMPMLVLGSMIAPTAKPDAAIRESFINLKLLGMQAVLGTMAGAVGIELGGARRLRGNTLDMPWIGDGNPKTTDNNLRTALRITHAAIACWVALLGLAYLNVT